LIFAGKEELRNQEGENGKKSWFGI
jgi:hypothetical protein